METNQPKFYTKLPFLYEVVLQVIGTIILVFSVGLLVKVVYDFFFTHKYYLNRRVLSKYLKRVIKDNIPFTTKDVSGGIIEYNFGTFNVWMWDRQLELSVHNDDDDIVGLFTSTIPEKLITIELIKQLKRLSWKQNQ